MRVHFGLLLLLLGMSLSCENESQESSINGVWESMGSGWILQIKDSSEYAFYDLTTISCLADRKGELNEIGASLELRGDTLSLLKGVTTYDFTRREKLPDLCTTVPDVSKTSSPLHNFAVFAETVREHYAFMELNNINWDELYSSQKSKLSEQSTSAELYLVIEETLEKLNDNHAYLEADDSVYEALEEISGEDMVTEADSLPEYGDFQVAEIVAKHHLKEDMTEDSWLIQWGKMNDSIGYIQVKAMWLYAKLDIPRALIDERGYVDAYVNTFQQMYEGAYIEEEVAGVRKIMNKVMRDLSETEAIVIDVRFNGGGQDAVAFEILRRFVPLKLQVATQKLKYGNEYTPILPLYINGRKDSYSRPVYVLTSAQTGSAAEAFTIATMAMKDVKRIGSSTSGAMSTALEKSLPNGWQFSISNEVYMDNQGINYENTGIPVDFELNYSTDRQTFFRSVVIDLEADKAKILKAIKAHQQK